MSLPAGLKRIVDQFASAPKEVRVQALLGYARRVPPLPPELAADPDGLERVHECQTPFFLATSLDELGRVHLFFDCPPEAPTVRGFAGILREGLEGLTASEILGVPPDFYARMGLTEVVSSLRLRGMGAILATIQRQVADRARDGAVRARPSPRAPRSRP
ncbi:MAG: SufE family protein [Gemmatimonadota bacterium]